MELLRKDVLSQPINDTVFKIAAKAKEAKLKYGNDKVVDATIGCLADENGDLVAFKSVYKHFDEVKDADKAAYAKSFAGNKEYRDKVLSWVLQDKITDLSFSVIATPGGTGADYLTISSFLDPGMEIMVPEIAWTSYQLMAAQNCLKVVSYPLFQHNHFATSNFKEIATRIMHTQHKLLVILNDPCHNPTGYSLTTEEWTDITAFLSGLSCQGQVIILNDVAYIDYSYNLSTSRDYLRCFNYLANNVTVIIAFSCSKTLTAYGFRLGAAIILNKDPEVVKTISTVYERDARAIWSNVNNGGMLTFPKVISDPQFLAEKQTYIELMHQRSELFMKEAQDNNLPYYPYKEGFFITLEVDPKNLDQYHEALMANQIYTVKVNKGIRLAICSLPINQISGLAKRMKEIYSKTFPQAE